MADAAPAPAIPRADVDALLTQWLDAQNHGDFDAYAALYASRFEGVRRTEHETFRLDHDAWIEDRRRLFQRPMQVESQDVEVVLTPTTAIVRMTQRWASGRYAEEGPKRMVLVREASGLRIASEEMIAAHAVAPTAPSSSGTFSAFDTRASTLIVLGEATERGRGAPRDVPAEGMRVATREPPEDVPPAFAALVGQTVQLVGDGGVCPLHVGSLAIASVVRPHFSTEQQWEGEDFDDTTPAVVTPRAQIALEVDAMAEHHYWVAVAPPSTCGRAIAAVALASAPVIAAPLQRPETLAAVLPLLFAGDARRELVTELREGKEAMGDAPGDDAALEAELRGSVQLRELGDAQTSVVEVRIPIPGECGGHEVVRVFTRSGDTLVPHDVPGWLRIDAAFDVDGDRTFEVAATYDLGDTRRVVRLGPTVETLTEWWISDFDCGC